MHVSSHIADFAFAEIRAFTTSEIQHMVDEINRVQSVIDQKQSDLSSAKWNPLNYVLGTQRDAIARMENAVAQDQLVLDQLKSSRDSVIESGDTDKMDEWFALAGTVGDAGDMASWNEQSKYARMSETVGTVAGQTAEQTVDVAKRTAVAAEKAAGGIGIGIGVAIAAVAMLLIFGRKRG